MRSSLVGGESEIAKLQLVVIMCVLPRLMHLAVLNLPSSMGWIYPLLSARVRSFAFAQADGDWMEMILRLVASD